MNQKTIGTLLAAAMLVLTALAGVAAPAAAQTTTETTDTSAPLNETVQVSEDVRALHVSAANATDVLNVTVYSIVNGSETQATTGTLDATANTTDTFEWSLPTDPADEYRVVVDGADVETVELYKIEKSQVGGGFLSADSEVPVSTAVIGGGLVLALLGVLSYGSDGRLL